jgi:serine phosphatase RsbU (regulator of sigma subunit)
MPTVSVEAPTAVGSWLVPIAGPPLEPIQLTDKEGGLTIGRHEQCDLCLPADAEKVSRFHARFARQEGRWRVADLNSRWGTFVNGVRANPGFETPLSDGDLIRITPWTFTLSPTAKRRGLQSQNDTGQTLVRAVTPERVRPLADDMLALLLESAAAIHAAPDEKQLAETVMDTACRGTGLTNAAMLRPIDPSSGQVEVIAARVVPTAMGPAPTIVDRPGAHHNDSLSGSVPRPHVPYSAGQHVSFSRSLITAASSGVVAEISSGGMLDQDISQSIVQMKINSAICVPLMLGSTVAAYLYLDSRGSVMQSLRPNASAFCVALGRIASLALANLKRIDMEKREERMRADLSAAAVAQRWIMPKRSSCYGPFNCTGESRPGQYVGGDFFDILSLPDGRLAVALGDVAGKGVSASVLMTATQGFLHACLQEGGNLGKVLDKLNKFVEPRCPESRFVTMWVGVLDSAEGTLRYVDAGHSFALLRRPSGTDPFEQLNKGSGLPVGLDEGGDYHVETIAVAPGDQLLIVSDGIIEQHGLVPGPSGTLVRQQFELEGVKHAWMNAGGDFVADLFNAVFHHAGTTQLADDATAVLVRIGGASDRPTSV